MNNNSWTVQTDVQSQRVHADCDCASQGQAGQAAQKQIMAKLFAVTIIVIAIASAIPILRHTWPMPEDISTHGHLIDEQMSETMAEAGISFLAAQFILAIFIWKFSNRAQGREDQEVSRRRQGAGHRCISVGGHRSSGSRRLRSQGLGQRLFHSAFGRRPADSGAGWAVRFLFPLSRPGRKVRPASSRSDQRGQRRISLVSIPTNDPDSKDDIVTAEMAIPVNSEIHLLMHAKDVGHSFFVPELRVQQDFVPGLDLSLHFTATKIGRYEIVCTQLCGLGHYNMKAYLSVYVPGRLRRLAEEAGGIAVARIVRASNALGRASLIEVNQCTTYRHSGAHHAPPTGLHPEARLQPRPQSDRQAVLRPGLGGGARGDGPFLADAHPPGLDESRHSRPASALQDRRPRRRDDAGVSTCS